MRRDEAGERGKRRGRRGGAPATRAAILAAAARQFAAVGYGKATLRSIAAEAGVDAALVSHFFGSKQGLFTEAVRLPVDPTALAAAIADGPPEGVGARVVGFVLRTFEHPPTRQAALSLLRAALTEPEAAGMLREVLTRRLVMPIAAALGADQAGLRTNLVGTQVVGLVIARYLLAVEPIASATPEVVIATIGPTVQRYLAGPLGK